MFASLTFSIIEIQYENTVINFSISVLTADGQYNQLSKKNGSENRDAIRQRDAILLYFHYSTRCIEHNTHAVSLYWSNVHHLPTY